MNSNVLFLVSSTYQLFNAIVLCETECKNEECDLLIKIKGGLDENIILGIKSCELFGTIITDISREVVETKYDKFFIAYPDKEWEMLYRQHIIRGKQPRVCIFDNEIISYKSICPNSKKARNAYYNIYEGKILSVYSYFPEFSMFNDIEIKKIYNPFDNLKIRNRLECIYGKFDDLKGKYIYWDNGKGLAFDKENISNILEVENFVYVSNSDKKNKIVEELGLNISVNNLLPKTIKMMQACLEGKVLIIPTINMKNISFMHYILGAKIIIAEKVFASCIDSSDKDREIEAYLKECRILGENCIYTPSSMEEMREIFRYFSF